MTVIVNGGRFDIGEFFDDGVRSFQVNNGVRSGFGQLLLPPIGIIFGKPFGLRALIDIDAYATVFHQGSGIATGSADFSHSFDWPGISSVVDAQGNSIDFTVLSDSGFDYSRAAATAPALVPEPSSLLLLVAGLLGLRRTIARKISP